jgi:hypothetical protein
MSSPQAPSPGNAILLPIHETNPSRRARILGEQFRGVGKIQRVEIRQMARDEGIYHHFQMFLSHRQTLTPKNANSPANKRKKPELKCSEQK